jgi:hypothetical protein
MSAIVDSSRRFAVQELASSTTLAKSSKPMKAKKASRLPKAMLDSFPRVGSARRRSQWAICMDGEYDDGQQSADLD